MKKEERAQLILQRVDQEGDIAITELAEHFGISEMTVRRDLEGLERAGALRRSLGRAIKGTSGSFEPAFVVRATRQSSEKVLIAHTVADLIADGETVVLDGGSTGVAIAHKLAKRQLTVCTPSLRVADALRDAPGVRLMLTGGIMRKSEESLVGPSAVATLEGHRFDTYIATVSAFDPQAGCTEWNVDDAIIKRAALSVSTRCIVAADSTKYGTTAFALICGLEAVSTIVSDESLGGPARREIELIGPTVLMAK